MRYSNPFKNTRIATPF